MATKNTQFIIISWQELDYKIQSLAEQIKDTHPRATAIQPLSKECLVAAHILAEYVGIEVSHRGEISFDLLDTRDPDYCFYATERMHEQFETQKEIFSLDTLYLNGDMLQRVKYPWQKL